MDLPVLHEQIARLQAHLTVLAARLDTLSPEALETLTYAVVPLLDRLESPETNSVLYDLTPQQCRDILDGISAGILIYDGSRVIRYANQKARDYIGYNPTGKNRDEYLSTIKLADANGQPLSINERPANLVWDGILARDVPMMITNADGKVFQVLVTAIPLLRKGSLIGAAVIWNDVTLLESAILEIKRQEEQLRVSDARFRLALDNSNIFVYTLDRDLRYTWLYSANHPDRAQRALGKRNDEIVTNSDISELEALKRQVIETGVGFNKEIALTLHGEQRVFNMSFEPLRDGTGQVIGLAGASMDITDQRRMEARQVEYAARLELHQRLMEQSEQNLLHYAQRLHDGPLQGMISLITDLQLVREIVSEGTDENTGPVAAVMNEIDARARDLADEIKRVCSELNPPSPTRFGLKRAIQAYTLDLQERYPAIRFQLNLMEDILKLPEPTCLAFYRIYREAVQNAIQHAAAQEISVRMRFNGNELTLEVSDDGCGFSPSNGMEMIQAGRFGLVSMKEQADALHGRFNLTSAPGAGTHVTVTVQIPD